MPKAYRNTLLKINLSKPKLTSEDKIIEPSRLYETGFNLPLSAMKQVLTKFKIDCNKLSNESVVKVFGVVNIALHSVGIPQGASTSPTLSTLVLDPLMRIINSKEHLKLVMYADDGIIFANRIY